MDKLLEELKKYLDETPKEELEKFAYLNEIGPDVLEYAEDFRIYSEKMWNISRNNEDDHHEYSTLGNLENSYIKSSYEYYLAA